MTVRLNAPKSFLSISTPAAPSKNCKPLPAPNNLGHVFASCGSFTPILCFPSIARSLKTGLMLGFRTRPDRTAPRRGQIGSRIVGCAPGRSRVGDARFWICNDLVRPCYPATCYSATLPPDRLFWSRIAMVLALKIRAWRGGGRPGAMLGFYANDQQGSRVAGNKAASLAGSIPSNAKCSRLFKLLRFCSRPMSLSTAKLTPSNSPS